MALKGLLWSTWTYMPFWQYCFSHWALPCFLYFPMGSLHVHRNRGWCGEDLHLLPPPLFFESINIKICRTLIEFTNLSTGRLFCCDSPTFDQWVLGPSSFQSQNKGRKPWLRAWIFEWSIPVLEYPFVLIDSWFDQLFVGTCPFENQQKFKTPWGRGWIFRWRIYVLTDHFLMVLPHFDAWMLGPALF